MWQNVHFPKRLNEEFKLEAIRSVKTVFFAGYQNRASGKMHLLPHKERPSLWTTRTRRLSFSSPFSSSGCSAARPRRPAHEVLFALADATLVEGLG